MKVLSVFGVVVGLALGAACFFYNPETNWLSGLFEPVLGLGAVVVGILGAWAILAYPKALEESRSNRRLMSKEARAVLRSVRDAVVLSSGALFVLVACAVIARLPGKGEELVPIAEAILAGLASTATTVLSAAFALTLLPLVQMENEVRDIELGKEMDASPFR